MHTKLFDSPAATKSRRRPDSSIFRFFAQFTFVVLAITLALAVPSAMAQTTVYDAVPGTLAPSYPSQPFQAQQTQEFGDFIHLAGTDRILNSVTMTMVSWAYQSEAGNVAYCAANPTLCSGAGWKHDFTLNIYNIGSGTVGTRSVGSLIASVTQNKTVPWRPAPTGAPCGGTTWQGPDLNCYNGMAYNVTFDMSSLGALLPNDVVVGIVYNTQTYGPDPMGVVGPFNSLNVGTQPGPAAVGTDDNIESVFWNTSTAGWYFDGGAAGVGVFREDYNPTPANGWLGYGTIPIKITATSPTTTNLVVQPSSPIFDGNNVTGVASDFAPGFASGSFASDGTGKTDMQFSPLTFFGRDVTLGEIKSMSYYTKTGATHAVDPRDWYMAIYTKPYAGDVSTPTWYGDRIGSEPYFSSSLTDPANTWNQWNTTPGNNRLRFFESTAGAPGATFGSYTDPNWDTFKSGNALSGQPYGGHQVLYFSIQTASGWANGFTGQVDGLRIELADGSVATVNFEACNDISTPNLTTLTGVPISVPVNTTDLTGRGAVSADFTFTYNPAVMTPVAGPGLATAGTVLAGTSPVITAFVPSPGTIVVSIFGTGATPTFSGAGSLVNLNFNVNGTIGSVSPLAVSNFLYNGGLICTTPPSNGTLTIISGTVTGAVSYAHPSALPVRGVLLSAPGSPNVSNTTGAAGTYSLSGFGAGSYTLTPSKTAYAPGNSNLDTGIFSDDASMIAQSLVGIIPPLSGARLAAAKVSGIATPTLSSFDAALISQWIVGLPNSPINQTGQWKFSLPNESLGIVTAAQTKNFTATLMGDVNGSWANLAGSFVETAALSEEQAKNAVKASLPTSVAPHGSIVRIPFNIDNLRGRGVTSFQFDVEYDPTILEPIANSASGEGTISDGLSVVSHSPSRGLLKVVVFGALPASGDGTYVNLRFNTIGEIGMISPLTIRAFRLNSGETDVITINGGLTVSAASNSASIAGRLLTPMGQGIRNARVIIVSSSGEQRSAVSGTFGNFVFSDLTVGETYTVTVQAKRYSFAPRTVSVVENVTEIDMIADQ